MPYPNQGSYGFPSTPYPNEGNYGSSPSIPYPEENDHGGITPKPYPDIYGGLPSIDYPNQGEVKGPNNFSPTDVGDESIGRPTESQVSWDIDIRTPNETLTTETTTTTTSQPQSPIDESTNENTPNAILGKPVIVPETTTPEGQIVFPDR